MFRDGMTYIAFYSRRFATATARTASLGSRSYLPMMAAIETKNIRKY
jgi:hypothetical protein